MNISRRLLIALLLLVALIGRVTSSETRSIAASCLLDLRISTIGLAVDEIEGEMQQSVFVLKLLSDDGTYASFNIRDLSGSGIQRVTMRAGEKVKAKLCHVPVVLQRRDSGATYRVEVSLATKFD